MITSRPFDAKEVAWVAKLLGVADEVDLDQLRRGMAVELEHGRRDPLTDVTNDDPSWPTWASTSPAGGWTLLRRLWPMQLHQTNALQGSCASPGRPPSLSTGSVTEDR